MPAQLTDFLAELEKRVVGDLRTDDYSRMFYSTDASLYQVLPHGVLIPRTTDDVHAAVELAARYQVPLLGRAGGSSLAGQAVNAALVIDFTRHLDQILEINRDERWVRVQPGCVLDELNRTLRPHGLQFGPDPASSSRAAMGGIVSNNSTGAHSIVYGLTADHVLETNVYLNDGSMAHFRPLTEGELAQKLGTHGREGDIYRHMAALTQNPSNQQIIRDGTPRHWRRCGGYNLDRFVWDDALSFGWPRDPRFNLSGIISGAEGTLGLITELKLNLVPTPPMTALAMVHFDRLRDALTAVPAMLEVNPSAIELLDNLGLTRSRTVPEYARLLDTFIEGDPYCVLITEFTGDSTAELRASIQRLEDHLRRQRLGATGVVAVYDSQRQANVWKVRKVGLGLLMSIKGDHKPIPFIEDAAVPPEHLADYIEKLERFCSDLGTDIAYYAHASAGCLHVRPLINTKAAQEVARMPQIIEFAVDLLHGHGGALSSEHGDGRARSWANERFFGPELYGLYRAVKRMFDPTNLFNPGNIVHAGPMTEHLRYGPDYATLPIQTHLDFSDDQGFNRAVEMCNGAGVCRKRTADTMCPSFMATREEEHSTRGRANALRNALAGKLPHSELTSPRMAETMALCISCKACKAECPSAVDMAKIKTEFLAQYYDTHGTPLRARFFANGRALNRLGSGAMAPLANWTLQNGLVRRLMARTLGITDRRALPHLAREPFPAWFRTHTPAHPPGGPTRTLALFHDPFTSYNQPQIPIAAVELFEAAGFEVVLPGHREDGRAAISKGLVAKARAIAAETVAALTPLAEQGLPIVGLEPSSLLTLRDEYRHLLPGDARVALIARHAYTFEEFVARLAERDDLRLTFTDAPRHILLHGHCHQKALVGTQPSHRTLTLPPNYTVEEVDSGCCGMAGSFGYEAEHYEISQVMAERRLLPAVRTAVPETLIAAAGVSCREQIQHGTGRRALHPVEILRDALHGR